MRFSKLPTMNSDSQPSFSNSQYTLFQEKIGCSLFYGGEGLRPKSAPCLQYYGSYTMFPDEIRLVLEWVSHPCVLLSGSVWVVRIVLGVAEQGDRSEAARNGGSFNSYYRRPYKRNLSGIVRFELVELKQCSSTWRLSPPSYSASLYVSPLFR